MTQSERADNVSQIYQYAFTEVNGLFIESAIDPECWPNGRRKPQSVIAMEKFGINGFEYVEVYQGLVLGEELFTYRSKIIDFLRPLLIESEVENFMETSDNFQFYTRPKPTKLTEVTRLGSWASIDYGFQRKDGKITGNEIAISINRGVIDFVKENPPIGMTPEVAAQMLIRENITHELLHLLMNFAMRIPMEDQDEFEHHLEIYGNVIVHGQVESPFAHFIKILKDGYFKIEKL